MPADRMKAIEEGCTRCGIGKPIFGDDGCIVCFELTSAVASLIKQILEHKLRAEARLKEAEGLLAEVTETSNWPVTLEAIRQFLSPKEAPHA